MDPTRGPGRPLVRYGTPVLRRNDAGWSSSVICWRCEALHAPRSQVQHNGQCQGRVNGNRKLTSFRPMSTSTSNRRCCDKSSNPRPRADQYSVAVDKGRIAPRETATTERRSNAPMSRRGPSPTRTAGGSWPHIAAVPPDHGRVSRRLGATVCSGPGTSRGTSDRMAERIAARRSSHTAGRSDVTNQIEGASQNCPRPVRPAERRSYCRCGL